MVPLRIALAEDDTTLRELTAHWLTELGHRVTPVGDGRALLELCRTTPIDLIVSDVGLPHMDGLTAATLLQRELELPAILA